MADEIHVFVKNYFPKPDKSARDKDASGMNRCKSSCTKIYCLVQTIPTKCACHWLCHHPVSLVLLASMTHQQVSHQHLDLTGGLKRSQHIFHHGLEQTISMVQNQKAFEITHQGWKYPHISQTSTASKITIATNRNGKWRNVGILPIGSVQNPLLFHCTGWPIGNPRMAGDNIYG